MSIQSTKTRGGGVNRSLNPLKAFTLAEVLITLVVIGIVAALTISILASKNEKAQLYTQFMKTYSTISNAINLAKIDHGDPSTWLSSAQGSSDYIKTYLEPYLINSQHKPISELVDSDYKDIDGRSRSAEMQYIISSDTYTVQLPSGAVVLDIMGAIAFDVNGRKGPNVFGRDTFIIYLSGFRCTKTGSPFCSDFTPAHCLTKGGFDSDGCAQKLLSEGKMNY